MELNRIPDLILCRLFLLYIILHLFTIQDTFTTFHSFHISLPLTRDEIYLLDRNFTTENSLLCYLDSLTRYVYEPFYGTSNSIVSHVLRVPSSRILLLLRCHGLSLNWTPSLNLYTMLTPCYNTSLNIR